MEYNEQAFKQFPVKISKGRLPQTKNEVVISEAIATNAKVDYKIGDQFTVGIGKQVFCRGGESFSSTITRCLQMRVVVIEELQSMDSKATFTVVGTIERPQFEPLWAPGYTVISYVERKKFRQR